ncbi:MAG TPA: DUF3549 family protein [Psychromonas hadalis]|nr:DUF3549 family protein [Psychromonas hadalis]
MNINTLTAFLDSSQCQFVAYDLGRLVTKISNADFKSIAENKQPYPFPLQQHAFIAITFWQAGNPEHFIWFLKLPLDEQGLLNITAQTSFIKMVIEAMGEAKNLTNDMSKELQERLASNPFIFKPSTEKLAIYNAKMNTAFVRPASSFYPATCRYIAHAKTEKDNWERLGFQGIADLACRLNYDNNQQALTTALPYIPAQPLQSLAICLEHSTDIQSELAQAIKTRANKELKADQQTLAILLLRALSNSDDKTTAHELIIDQFSSELVFNQHWYIAIAGRCWCLLEDETLLNRFLESLANHHPALFSQLFSDLVAIPSLRAKVLKQLRLTARSPALSEAIGILFSNVNAGEK